VRWLQSRTTVHPPGEARHRAMVMQSHPPAAALKSAPDQGHI